MSKKNDTVRNLKGKGSILRFITYTLVIVFFLVIYVINERLNGLNFMRPSGEHDYLLLQESSYIIVALFILMAMMAVADWSIAKSRHINNLTLVGFGVVSYGAVLVCLFDITIGSWGIPGRCGGGFTLGNCFLAEGLGEMIYVGLIPVAFTIGTVLLVINKHKRP